MRRVKGSSVGAAAWIFLSAPVSAQDLTPFVEANAIHTLFHEIGHAVIDQFQLPVIGQEEDAADSFATLEIINAFEDDAKPILIDVASAWLHLDAKTDREDLDFFDEHDLDAQRAYRTICHLYGIDPDANADAAEWADLPDETLDTCTDTAPLAQDSWEMLLQSGVLLGNDEPQTPIDVSYEETSLTQWRSQLMDSGLMDDLAIYAQTSFAWPNPVRFVASECGEANAFYDPQTVTVTLCYEILDDWAIAEVEILSQ